MAKITINTIFIVLGGIPLLIYPVVILADIMTLAAESSGDESWYFKLIVRLFLILNSSYLLTYICCFIYFLTNKSGRLWITSLPLIQVIIVIFVGYIWSILGK